MSRRSPQPRYAAQLRGGRRLTMGPARQYSESPVLPAVAAITATLAEEPEYVPVLPPLPSQWKIAAAFATSGVATISEVPGGSLVYAVAVASGGGGIGLNPRLNDRPQALASGSVLRADVTAGVAPGGDLTAYLTAQTSPYPDFLHYRVYYLDGQGGRYPQLRDAWAETGGPSATLIAPDPSWSMVMQGTAANGWTARPPEIPTFSQWSKSRSPQVMSGIDTMKVPGGVGAVTVNGDPAAPSDEFPSAWFTYSFGIAA